MKKRRIRHNLNHYGVKSHIPVGNQLTMYADLTISMKRMFVFVPWRKVSLHREKENGVIKRKQKINVSKKKKSFRVAYFQKLTEKSSAFFLFGLFAI